jgi:dihydrofolate reductase
MTVIATITTSLDGFVTGPSDGPGCGLGVGGERLHYWVFGGPWTYADGPSGDGAMRPEDQAHYDALTARMGAVVVGRGMYEAAGAWGGQNPWPAPAFVLTHRSEDPHPDDFTFVEGLDDALARADEAAGGRDVVIGGGADLIRQALTAGVVDEIGLSIAPVTLGAGKRLLDGVDVVLAPLEVRQSAYATHIWYAVRRD